MTVVADKGVIGGSKSLALDKLPLLGEMFNQIATICAERMRERSPTSILLRPRGLTSDREESVLASFDPNILAFVLHDGDWDCRFVLVLDQAFVFTLIEAMFGADGGDAAFVDVRPFSTIERGVAKSFVEVATDALNRAITLMTPADFELEKVETRLDFISLGGRNEDAVLARIGIDALGRTGEMSILLPQRAIERLRPHLAKAPVAEPLRSADPQWSQEFGQRVARAEVSVGASVDIEGFCLGDVAAFEVGQVISMGLQAQRQVLLNSEDEALFRCELGQSDGFYSIRVTAELEHGVTDTVPAMELVED